MSPALTVQQAGTDRCDFSSPRTISDSTATTTVVNPSMRRKSQPPVGSPSMLIVTVEAIG